MKRRLLTFLLLLSGMVLAELPIPQLKSFLCSLSNEFQASEIAELNSVLSCEDEELFRSYFERIYLGKADEILQNRLSQFKAGGTNDVNKGIADIKGDLKDFNDFQLIMKRLNDNADSLMDLPKFKNVLKHAELSNKIYWKAERIFFKADYARAKEIFEFLERGVLFLFGSNDRRKWAISFVVRKRARYKAKRALAVTAGSQI